MDLVTRVRSVDAYDDANFALYSAPEHSEGILISAAFIRGDGPINTVEFEHNTALIRSAFKGSRGHPAGEKAPPNARSTGVAASAYLESAIGSETEW